MLADTPYLKSPILSFQLSSTSKPLFSISPAFTVIEETPDSGKVGALTSKSLVFFLYQSRPRVNLSFKKRKSAPKSLCYEVSQVKLGLAIPLGIEPKVTELVGP